MDGPADFPFKLFGFFEFKLGIKNGFTTATFSAPGKIVLKLPNGCEYQMTSKTVEITGLMYKEKNLNVTGSMNITDVTNNLNALISFDAQ